MRIGIMTHWWCQENYGQQLQAFALQRILKDRGHQPYLIRYHPVSSWKRRVKRALFSPGLIVDRLKTFKASANDRASVREERAFETFKKRYILSTHEVFKSYAQLCDSDEIYADAYICGSDQVWNENFVMHDDNGRPWFLDFGSADTKRIAYAPSFGASALSQSYIKYITPMLKQFDAISVREVTGVELCRKAGRYDAVHVLDPTLLLDKKSYQEAFVNEELRTSIEGAYAFLYFLKNGNEDDDNPFGAVVETCHKMGLKIVVATVYEDIEELKPYTIQPTIPEWVELVRGADVVFTNSFHGTAFSILMNRPFVVFPRKHKASGMNSRIESLLGGLGLNHQIYQERRSIEQIASIKIGWDAVNEKLQLLRQGSLAYLNRSKIV